MSILPFHQFSEPRIHGHFNQNQTFLRSKQRRVIVTSCNRRVGSATQKNNYYELLGVSVDSSAQEIKEAYRRLQKKHHPDIAGQKGHEHTLMLNEAYKVLMRQDLRREYDVSIDRMRTGLGRNNHVKGYSTWKGPWRPQALFVDENVCIGCRECVHHAGNTFMMDEALGCARVKVQYGDDDPKIEASVDSCPVNCIHWVNNEELALLEHVTQPKLKEGYGVFGQGWDRPTNVFMAAKSFKKQLKRQAEHYQTNMQATVEQETPAQAEARVHASLKIKRERFSIIWNLVEQIFGSNVRNRK